MFWTLKNLSIGYETKTLAEDITFTLHRGESLGVIGANGTGKTTFLKTVLGKIPELGGKMLWGLKTDIGYYSQTLDDLNSNNTILEEIRLVDSLADSGKLRSFMARFLFVGDDVFKKVGTLSGGEKGRLSLAKLIYSNKNVLSFGRTNEPFGYSVARSPRSRARRIRRHDHHGQSRPLFPRQSFDQHSRAQKGFAGGIFSGKLYAVSR